MSSAADHAQQPRFLTGQSSQFRTTSKATAPTICYTGSDLDGVRELDSGLFQFLEGFAGTSQDIKDVLSLNGLLMNP